MTMLEPRETENRKIATNVVTEASFGRERDESAPHGSASPPKTELPNIKSAHIKEQLG